MDYLKKYIKVFNDVTVDDWILPEIISLDNLFKEVVPGIDTHSTSKYSFLRLEKYKDLPDEVFEKLFGPLQMGVVQTVDEYSQHHPDFKYDGLNGSESFTLTKYSTGGFFNRRSDYTPVKSRVLSFHLTLNDDYRGGEFSFFDGQYIVPTKKNQVIIFPASFMFNYALLPITEGTRWAAENWTN